jgi:hypothetical protein
MAMVSEPDGIVIRQRLSASSAVLTHSPDLIVTGAEPALSPDLFRDSEAYRRWYFSRSPVPGAPNYVYVRGRNYSPTGAQQARVYLYWTTADELLDPAKWRSSGFTVDGDPRNDVTVSAISRLQYVLASVQWTPAGQLGTRFFLISWIDNSADPKPPAWPAAFPDPAALRAYIEAHEYQMAVLDTIYRGAFLRQSPGQTVFQGGTGAKTSPDLQVSGTTAVRDAAALASRESYLPGRISATAVLDMRNFIYVRAINTTGAPASARVYLYWATGQSLSPPSWSKDNFTYAGHPQNWVDLVAAAPEDVMVSTVPLVWSAPVTSDPLVLIAYADNSPDPEPPDFGPFGFLDPDFVAKFVAGQPQLAWVAITSQPPPAPRPAMTSQTPLAAGTGTGSNSLYVGVQLSDVPTDGTLSLSVPGPNADSTVIATSMRIPDPNAFVAWPVTYPDEFRTSAVISYTAGPTPPGNSKIEALLVSRPTKAR